MLRLGDVEKQVTVEDVLGLKATDYLVRIVWNHLAHNLEEDTYNKLKRTQLEKGLTDDLEDWWHTDVIGELVSD